MSNLPNLARISDADLAERWFALRNKTWRLVAETVKASGVDQKTLADRIGMNAGQFSKIVTGRKGNVTLRTLHNIARAANSRLQISLVPLSDLPKPNYSFEANKRDRLQIIERRTETVTDDDWTRETLGSKYRALEPV